MMNENTRGKIIRTNFHEAQLLTAEDLRNEQDYHAFMRRLHNKAFHTQGIVTGCALRAVDSAPDSIFLEKGLVLIDDKSDYDDLVSYEAYFREDLRIRFLLSNQASDSGDNSPAVSVVLRLRIEPGTPDTIHPAPVSFYHDDTAFPCVCLDSTQDTDKYYIEFNIVTDYYDGYFYSSRDALAYSQKFKTQRNIFQLELPRLSVSAVDPDNTPGGVVLGTIRCEFDKSAISPGSGSAISFTTHIDPSARKYSGLVTAKLTLDRLNFTAKRHYIYGRKGEPDNGNTENRDNADNSLGICGKEMVVERVTEENADSPEEITQKITDPANSGNTVVKKVPLVDLNGEVEIARDLAIEGALNVEGSYLSSSEAYLGRQVIIEDDVLTLKINNTDSAAGLEIGHVDKQAKSALLWKKNAENDEGNWVLNDNPGTAADRKIAFGLEELMYNNNADKLHGHDSLKMLKEPGTAGGTPVAVPVVKVDATHGSVIISPDGTSPEANETDETNKLYIKGNLRFIRPGQGVYFRNDTSGRKMVSVIKRTLLSHTHVIVPSGDMALDMAELEAKIADDTSLFIADGRLEVAASGIDIIAKKNLRITGSAKLRINIQEADGSTTSRYLFKLSGTCRNIAITNLSVNAADSGLLQIATASDVHNLKISGCTNTPPGTTRNNRLSLVYADNCDLMNLEILANTWKRDGSHAPALMRFSRVYLENVKIADNTFISGDTTYPDAINISFRNKLATPPNPVSSSNLTVSHNSLSGFGRYCVIQPAGTAEENYHFRNLVFEQNRLYEPVEYEPEDPPDPDLPYSPGDNIFVYLHRGTGSTETPVFSQVRIDGNTFSSRREEPAARAMRILWLENVFSGNITNNDFCVTSDDTPLLGFRLGRMLMTKNRISGSSGEIVLEPPDTEMVHETTNLFNF